MAANGRDETGWGRDVMLKVLDLFSGIGGFSLGLERAGFETAAFCEIDPFCRQVLTKHWPDVPIFEDVTKLRGEDVGPVDVVCGGFPCQPFSNAGERKGTEDDRHLWPEMLRIIEETQPSWVIGENVAGLTSMGIRCSEPRMEGKTLTRTPERDDYDNILTLQEKMLLNEICLDLEKSGYDAQPINIPACAVGAWHKRARIWIIAHTNNTRQQSGARCGKDDRNQQGDNFRRVCTFISDATSERIQGGWPAGEQEPKAHGEEALSLRCGSKLGTEKWAAEPGVGRVAHGVSNRVDRIKSLGNAVVPQIPEILGKAILAVEANL